MADDGVTGAADQGMGRPRPDGVVLRGGGVGRTPGRAAQVQAGEVARRAVRGRVREAALLAHPLGRDTAGVVAIRVVVGRPEADLAPVDMARGAAASDSGLAH